jgi:hypothetical protein
MASLSKQLAESDLAGVRTLHLPAHDGRKIAYEHLITPTAKQELAEVSATGLRRHHAQLTPGGVGCYLSHVDTWRYILEDAQKRKDMDSPTLVLEDDVNVPRIVKHALEYGWSLANQLVGDRAPVMLHFQMTCLSGCEPKMYGLVEPNLFWGMRTFLLNGHGARALLSWPSLFPIDVQIDSVLRYARNKGAIAVLLYPAMPDRQDSSTDIQTNTVPGAPIDRP